MFDFSIIGETLNKFAGELKSLRSEIEDVSRQIEDVRYAPACKDDVVNAFGLWAESHEKTYRSHLNGVLVGLVSRPEILPSPDKVADHLRIHSLVPNRGMDMGLSPDAQICGLLGKVGFLELLRPRLDELDWSESGKPAAEREKLIADLTKKLSRLRAEELALMNSAAAAGFAVS